MTRDPFTYLTAFLCGASIMAVELAATRLLAPYYGASMVVWTIVIGVMLAAISIGNVAGGIIADRSAIESQTILYKMIWAASLWIAAIPLVGKYVVASSFFLMMWLFPGNVLTAGTVFSCITCFAPPCLILGAVTPCLVKSATADLARNGQVAGELYALSTIGSIVGTFLPTFWTIPLLGTARTFYLFALILNLTATVFFLRRHLHRKRALVSAVMILALLCLIPADRSFAFWKTPILEDESIYNYLMVDKFEGGGLGLSTHVLANVQSFYREENALVGGYWDFTLLGPFWRPGFTGFDQPFRALVLGLGTGTFARQCRYFFPRSVVDGVDIDQRIVDLSRSHFGLKPDDANVYVDDGRTFLTGGKAGMYDVILLDTYRDLTIPFHLATREFFELVKSHLATDGALVINVNMRAETPEKNDISEHLVQTIRSVFPCVFRCDLPEQTNVMVYATPHSDGFSQFSRNVQTLPQKHPLTWIARDASDFTREVTESRLVLTDDLAPVEMLGEQVLNDMVRDGLREVLVRVVSSF
ncbi:MAG: fused MFS/spermidine synthase [Candidatus Ozemobacteraceae bacterium]